MFHCNECGAGTPDECRRRHSNATDERARRTAEIFAAIDAMTDEEFRAFNARLMNA